MPKFKTLNGLKNYIQRVVEDILQNEVADDVVDKLKKNYDEEVYSYQGSGLYDRRNSLTDNDNYKKEIVDKMTVSIGSNAEPNDSLNNTPLYSDPEGLLPKWIEEGDIPNIFNGEKYPWMKPRPVVEMTRDELMNTKSYIEAMKKGLHRSGINTE